MEHGKLVMTSNFPGCVGRVLATTTWLVMLVSSDGSLGGQTAQARSGSMRCPEESRTTPLAGPSGPLTLRAGDRIPEAWDANLTLIRGDELADAARFAGMFYIRFANQQILVVSTDRRSVRYIVRCYYSP